MGVIMSKFIDLKTFGLEFKHIITGPAPVGRILNYVKLIGEGKLKHKNGSRDLSLNDGIGSAWATEFLVGLGLATYDSSSRYNSAIMYLTSNGKNLYESIKTINIVLDESPDISLCKQQVTKNGDKIISIFEKTFRDSVVFKNLEIYLADNGYRQYFKNNTFIDNYFETLKIYYEGGTYDRNVRTTAGQNRVPSLIQLCTFFGYLSVTGEYGVFDLNPKYYVDENHIIIDYTKEIDDLKKNEVSEQIIIDDLVKKYGIDGTVVRELLQRNSRLQEIFKHNLNIEFEGKCAICGKDLLEILIASHIKPSAQSNVFEKIDNNNGLLLCANHDKLFDRYLISFDFNDGKLIFIDYLNEKLEEFQIPKSFSLDSKYLTEKRKDFLLNHNLEFYSKNRG
jgi:hypothetical protein